MRGNLKAALALGVLALGASGAVLFRKEQPRQHPDAEIQERLILKPSAGPHFLTEARPAVATDFSSPPLTLPPALLETPAERVPAIPLASLSPLETADPVPPPIAFSYPGLGSEDGLALADDVWRPADEGYAVSSDWIGPRPHRLHTIVDGDTLPAIAARYLGNADRYLEIYEANRDVLESPDMLPIGVELKIPPRSDSFASLESADATLPLVPLTPRDE